MSEGRLQTLAERISKFARSSQLPAENDGVAPGGAIRQISKPFGMMADHMDLAPDGESLLAALIATSADAIIGTTLQGIVTFWSPSATEIFGHTEAEIIGRPLAGVLPPDSRNAQAQIATKVSQGERIRNFQTMRCRRNGTLFPACVTLSPLRDKNGAIIGVLEITRDMTAAMKQAEALQHAAAEYREKLRKSKQTLDEFAYVTARDLQAPLRVIDNISQWLQEDLKPYLTPETQDNMALLRSRVKRMEKLLGDLLDYSRIGRKQDDRFAEIVNGEELLEHVLDLLAPPAAFSIAVDAGFREIAVLRMPLQQVLMHLIGNAIKHHDKPDGKIRLGVKDAGEWIEFTVEDDGPGIAPQFHEKIFEPFHTLQPRDQMAGSGMGLAIVRRRVEMSGGIISLQSAPGQGSRFTFTWPKFQPARTGDEALPT